jgi:hypothetical protein
MPTSVTRHLSPLPNIANITGNRSVFLANKNSLRQTSLCVYSSETQATTIFVLFKPLNRRDEFRQEREYD